MTGQELKDKVKRYMNKEPSDDDVLDGIQEAMNELGVRNHLIDTEDISAAAKDENTLPNNYIRVIKVEIPEENKYYFNYLIDGNKIRFANEDDYKIYYQKHPETYKDLSEELPMHPMLQKCVLDYVKGHCKVIINDTSEDGHRLLQQFTEKSMMAYEVLTRNQKTPSKVRVYRHG